MTLAEKQWELDGVVFGTGAPVEVESFTPEAPESRTNDTANPVGDGVRPGRDTKGAATWGFSLFSNGENEQEAWDFLAPLAAAWDNEEVRLESGAVVPLRYRLAGQNRRVYGRPTRFTPVPDNTSLGGHIAVEADFRVMDHRVYEDDVQSVPFGLGTQLAVENGIITPFITPFVSNATSIERKTTITVGGTMRTPVWITFEGAIENASVRIGSWVAALRDPMDGNEKITIDGRPWIRSAMTESGSAVRVSPRLTRINEMFLPPGQHEVTFTGMLRSGSGSALVSWRNAHRLPR